MLSRWRDYLLRAFAQTPSEPDSEVPQSDPKLPMELPQSSPRLPMELLLHEVMPHLVAMQDLETLKALSQICWAFVAPYQRVLYRKISWKDGCTTARDLQYLMRSKSPHLAGYIRHVNFSLHPELQAQTKRFVAAVFNQLPKVVLFDLSAPGQISWSSLSPEFEGSFVRIIQGTSLVFLALKSLNHVPVSVLALSSVRTLMINNTHILADVAVGSKRILRLNHIVTWWHDDVARSCLKTLLQFSKQVSQIELLVMHTNSSFAGLANTLTADPLAFRNLQSLQLLLVIRTHHQEYTLYDLIPELGGLFNNVDCALTKLILQIRPSRRFHDVLSNAFTEIDDFLAQVELHSLQEIHLEYTEPYLLSSSLEHGLEEEEELKIRLLLSFPRLRNHERLQFCINLIIVERWWDSSIGCTTETLTWP